MKHLILVAVLLTGIPLCAQKPVYVAESVSVGGIQQFITIEGQDASLPILLFLHGGPGGSMMPYSEKFTDKLYAHFLVVHWDQRETGETLRLNASPEPLSFSLFQQDTEEIIRYLLDRFQREKLYLAAHSWGTALGFAVVRDHPERFYAYLPIGPMVNQLESERIALELLLTEAKERGGDLEYASLLSVSIPFENADQLYAHRKALQNLSGSRRSLTKSYVEAWSARWLKVFNEASQINLVEDLPAVGCPVYFFVGSKDLQTNAMLANAYYERLTAPRKAFFWFEGTGHALPTASPERLQQLIIEQVLPETFPVGNAGKAIGIR